MRFERRLELTDARLPPRRVRAERVLQAAGPRAREHVTRRKHDHAVGPGAISEGKTMPVKAYETSIHAITILLAGALAPPGAQLALSCGSGSAVLAAGGGAIVTADPPKHFDP